MNKEMKKLIGILLCMLMVATTMPAVIGAQTTVQTNSDQDLSTPIFQRAFILGRISNIHKIGNIVLARAMKVHYIGMVRGHMDMGTAQDKVITFIQNAQFHMIPMNRGILVFGMVRYLVVW